MSPAPFCFRLLEPGYGVDERPVIAENSPRCVGSACAAWRRDMPETGSCGLVHGGQTFQDPARPTTRQTTPKPRPSTEQA